MQRLPRVLLIRTKRNTETFEADEAVFVGTCKLECAEAGISKPLIVSGDLKEATYVLEVADLNAISAGTYEYTIDSTQSGQGPEHLGVPGQLVVRDAP